MQRGVARVTTPVHRAGPWGTQQGLVQQGQHPRWVLSTHRPGGWVGTGLSPCELFRLPAPAGAIHLPVPGKAALSTADGRVRVAPNPAQRSPYINSADNVRWRGEQLYFYSRFGTYSHSFTRQPGAAARTGREADVELGPSICQQPFCWAWSSQCHRQHLLDRGVPLHPTPYVQPGKKPPCQGCRRFWMALPGLPHLCFGAAGQAGHHPGPAAPTP